MIRADLCAPADSATSTVSGCRQARPRTWLRVCSVARCTAGEGAPGTQPSTDPVHPIGTENAFRVSSSSPRPRGWARPHAVQLCEGVCGSDYDSVRAVRATSGVQDGGRRARPYCPHPRLLARRVEDSLRRMRDTCTGTVAPLARPPAAGGITTSDGRRVRAAHRRSRTNSRRTSASSSGRTNSTPYLGVHPSDTRK